MKSFFEQCLRDLHQLTGLKQYIEICNKQTEKEAKDEMDVIVRGMVMISEKFNYIPQDVQKRIVRHQMVSDGEMYALNAKFVNKWFNAVAAGYWKESGHLETNRLNEAEIVVEPMSEETKKLWDKRMAELAEATIKEVPKVSEIELNKIRIEDKQRQEGALSKGYPQPTVQELERRNLHLQWIRENTDRITGKLLPDGLDEQTWLKQKQL